ncbi:hypothetical protein LCGC14_2891800, partial [marine sediment metagenome]
MIVITPMSGFGLAGLSLGQSRSAMMEEAITQSLTAYRLRPFPTSPENPWKLGATNFAKLVNKALDVGLTSGFSYSSQEIAAALVARGYT